MRERTSISIKGSGIQQLTLTVAPKSVLEPVTGFHRSGADFAIPVQGDYTNAAMRIPRVCLDHVAKQLDAGILRRQPSRHMMDDGYTGTVVCHQIAIASR